MLSPSLEDYLEETYRLQQYHDNIRVSDIAACLKVSLPSVVKALKRLQQEGYLHYGNYGKIKLTALGQKKGKFLCDRNHIVREFLNVLYCPCDISAEAEAMEHYLSESTVELMRNLIDFMHTYPDIREKFHLFSQMNRVRNSKSTIL